ncbi:hypothetical protein LCGC14_3048090 [marine sediment metagenome]|uniref:Uncharacterized protein n=1 Tax=marine sediment metagenome TaxID=412755 RepID=A0A0F8YVF9_9ZZZZ
MTQMKEKLVRVTAVEILPPESSSSLLVEQDARLQRIVQEEVARILVQKENNLLQPWFTSPAFAQEVRRQQTVEERFKFADFFEGEGCLRCRKQTPQHAGNSLCLRCRNWFVYRLKHHMKKRRQRTERGER